ncbi:MAG: hypothetical protein ABFD82_21155 [Syntrophaceae bacterium]
MKIFNSADVRLGINKTSKREISVTCIRVDFIDIPLCLGIDNILYIDHEETTRFVIDYRSKCYTDERNREKEEGTNEPD